MRILEIPDILAIKEIAKQNQRAIVTPTEQYVLFGKCRRAVVSAQREIWSHAERLAKLQIVCDD